MTFATDISTSQLAIELLAQGQSVRMQAMGASMRPWLQPGTLVTVFPLSPNVPLNIGDVVFVTTNGRPALHRVIQTYPELLTKGDALGLPDFPPIVVYGRANVPSLPLIASLSRLIGPLQQRLLLWRLRLFPRQTSD